MDFPCSIWELHIDNEREVIEESFSSFSEDAIACMQIPTYYIARLVLENRKPLLSRQLFGYSAFHADIKREQAWYPSCLLVMELQPALFLFLHLFGS